MIALLTAKLTELQNRRGVVTERDVRSGPSVFRVVRTLRSSRSQLSNLCL